MQTRRFTLAVIASAAAGAALLNAFGQGSLTPPAGPAGPTMRTLTQVEPRIPLTTGSPGVTVNANGGFTITASGSYYLVDNLTVSNGSGILINTGGVTLDLMGFTIAGTNPSTAAGQGILVSNASFVTVRNGHIRSTSVFNEATGEGTNTGFLKGVDVSGTRSAITASDLTVTKVNQTGIDNCHTLDRCTVTECLAGVDGATLIRDCRVEKCNTCIFAEQAASISRCRLVARGPTAWGIYAPGCSIAECTVDVSGPGCTGIIGGTGGAPGSTISSCQVFAGSSTSTFTTGIANPAGHVSDCRVEATAAAGSNSIAIDATDGIVSRCFAMPASTAGGTHVAIKAKIADACLAVSGTTAITNRYNMPASP